MANTRISGYCPAGRMTAKAIRFTLTGLDGESASADTVWLPRSLCADLSITEDPEDGILVSATVPEWFARKAFDTRPGWQRAGLRSAPFATRPF